MKRLLGIVLILCFTVACAAGGRSDVLSVNGKDTFIYYDQVSFRENYVVLPLQRVLEGLGAENTGYQDSKNSKEVLNIGDQYFVFDNFHEKLYLVDRDVYNARGSSLYNIMLEEYSVLPSPVENDDCFISGGNGVLLDQNSLAELLKKAGITITVTIDYENRTVSIEG